MINKRLLNRGNTIFGAATVGVCSLILLPTSAIAAVIQVDTTADTLADDGQCSLREAITAANTNLATGGCVAGEGLPVVDEIELPWGIYRLNRAPAGENDNLGGDLDIHESVNIRGTSLATFDPQWVAHWSVDPSLLGIAVVENRRGRDHVGDDGDRVFHIHEGSGEDVDILLENFAITGGLLECTGSLCEGGGAGISSESAGVLELSRMLISGNLQSCTEPSACSGTMNEDFATGAAAIWADTPRVTNITDSAVVDNRAECYGADCHAGAIVRVFGKEVEGEEPGASFVASQSIVDRNATECDGYGSYCEVDEILRIHAQNVALGLVSIADNWSVCRGLDCDTDELVELYTNTRTSDSFVVMADVDIHRNALSCYGDECDTDEIIDAYSGFAEMTWNRVSVAHNSLHCVGYNCDTDEIIDARAEESLSWDDVDVLNNHMTCVGDECDADEWIDLGTPGGDDATISGLRVLDNSLSCQGVHCDGDDGVDLHGDGFVLTSLDARRNVSLCAGDYCATESILDLSGDAYVVSDAVITDNQVTCLGTPCSVANECRSDGGVCSLGSGGAVHNYSENAQLNDVLIAHNFSSGSGSAIVNGGTLSLTNSVLQFNQSRGGGGAIFNAHQTGTSATISDFGVLHVEDSQITWNHAVLEGGGIWNPEGASMSATDTTIQLNTSLIDGGGIYNEGTISSISGGSISWNFPWFSDCVDAGTGSGCP